MALMALAVIVRAAVSMAMGDAERPALRNGCQGKTRLLALLGAALLLPWFLGIPEARAETRPIAAGPQMDGVPAMLLFAQGEQTKPTAAKHANASTKSAAPADLGKSIAEQMKGGQNTSWAIILGLRWCGCWWSSTFCGRRWGRRPRPRTRC
jgi:hypothetical protein